MKARELLLEVRNIANSASTRIEEKTLSQSTKMKPEVVSIIARIRDLYDKIALIMDSLVERVGEELEPDAAIDLGPRFYIVFYKDKFVIVRSKPFYTILSYDHGDGKISVKTRNLSSYMDQSSVEITFLSMKVSIRIDDVKEYIEKINELKYLLKPLGRVIEYYLVPIIESRLKTS